MTAQAANPYLLFREAAGKRKQIGCDEASQRVARALIARGAVAYENAQGLIRDVGAPRVPEDAGRVFSKGRVNDGQSP